MYNRDKIMRKLLGKPTVESSHDTTVGVTSSPLPAAYRPSAAQNALFNAGVPIACLAKSPDGRCAILAGRHILKVVKLDGLTVKEGTDLRATITSQPSSKVNSTADQLSIKDVNWPSGRGDTTVFTACANGKIFQYDLARMGGPDGGQMEVVQMREDSRQVNTLDVNPHRGTYLLSGSQDGIVRCFDIRSPQRSQLGFLTYRSVQAFKCNAEGVRHVKWSPKDGFYFACATEQGVVLKWDIRKSTAPILRINGHEKACASIAWHPDGEHLISGGSDNKCFVWDVSSRAEKRQKPKWTLNTPAPIASVAWRPGTWSATAQGKRTAQVAVTYDDSSQMRHGINACHIWDLARPTLPFKELQNFDAPPAALLWHDQDLLWTAGHDGLFNQFDIAFAPKVMDRTSVSTMAFSSQGDVLMFLDERPVARRMRPAITTPSEVLSHGSYSSSPTTPMLSISRSDSEDEVVGSFLRSRGKGRRKRTPSTRSAHTLSTTPPGGPDDHSLALEPSLKVTGFYKSQQGMAIGPVPSSAKVNIYHYLSVHYLETLYELLPSQKNGPILGERVNTIIEHYAKAAEKVSLFRLAQTWRILAYAMNLLLTRRAQYHLDCRTGRLRDYSLEHRQKERSTLRSTAARPTVILPAPSLHDGATHRKPPTTSSLDKSGAMRSLLSEEFESTSNVPTPLARPVDDEVQEGGNGEDLQYRYASGKKLTPVVENDSFSLPPALHSFSFASRRRLDSEPLSVVSHDSERTHASTEGYDFYDLETMTHAIDVPSAKSKDQSSAGFVKLGSPNRRQSAKRHDSDESFAQLFSISGGSRQSTGGLTGSSDSSSIPRRPERLPATPRQYSDTGSDSTSGEYGSRIRGRHMEESPEFRKMLALRKPIERADSNLTDDYALPTQTTTDSLDSHDGAHPKPDLYPHDTPSDIGHSDIHSFGHPDSERASPEKDGALTPEVTTDRDYLPWSDDDPYPYVLASEYPEKPRVTPLEPYTLITRALQFEAKSSALNASAMILLLKPLLPKDLIDLFQATAILKQHHSRLMGMKLFTEAALLRNLCVKGWPGEPLSDWGDNFQSIFMPAQQNVLAGFFCPKCRKPREVDRKSNGGVWRCERCHEVMGPCAVCGHRDVTENTLPEVSQPLSLELVLSETAKPDAAEHQTRQGSILSTWWFCAGCGHGGHSTCLQGWHSSFADATASGVYDPGQLPDMGGEFSDGCCPLDGCGHACLPGKWQAETAVASTEEVSRVVREVTRSKSTSSPKLHGEDGRRRGGLVGSAGSDIHGDLHEVAQSRAVASVRETLASSGNSRLPGASVLSSSPGRSTGMERERRKSVKFAGTEERR